VIVRVFWDAEGMTNGSVAGGHDPAAATSRTARMGHLARLHRRHRLRLLHGEDAADLQVPRATETSADPMIAGCLVVACFAVAAVNFQIGQTNIQTRYNRKEKREARMAIVPVLQVRVRCPGCFPSPSAESLCAVLLALALAWVVAD